MAFRLRQQRLPHTLQLGSSVTSVVRSCRVAVPPRHQRVSVDGITACPLSRRSGTPRAAGSVRSKLSSSLLLGLPRTVQLCEHLLEEVASVAYHCQLVTAEARGALAAHVELLACCSRRAAHRQHQRSGGDHHRLHPERPHSGVSWLTRNGKNSD
eukprot:scaffold8166_cov376-Prasinococcus_capsulatus_cf.AAC.6